MSTRLTNREFRRKCLEEGIPMPKTSRRMMGRYLVDIGVAGGGCYATAVLALLTQLVRGTEAGSVSSYFGSVASRPDLLA